MDSALGIGLTVNAGFSGECRRIALILLRPYSGLSMLSRVIGILMLTTALIGGGCRDAAVGSGLRAHLV